METREISREWLREKYETCSVREISEELGVTPPTVYRLLTEAGIPRKSKAKKWVIVDE